VIFIQRSDRQVLLQLRSVTRKMFPGRVDCSTAFHVTYGETCEEAAMREMLEETGISSPLRRAGTFTHHDHPENQIVAVFISRSDQRPVIDPSEADGYEYRSPEEIDNIAAGGKATPWLRDGWKLARPLLE
jgi:isopentenyldiphosphate isomerase